MSSPPRALSVHDADYDPAVGESIVVRLDGVDQHGRVEAYDVDAGTVTRCKLDARGYTFAEDDEIARETVHGVVTAEFKAALDTPSAPHPPV
ncbi:hypothetical protein C8J42_103570 [Sphingomonas sp. PP-CE-1A-559]|uniref:hypothetical protein n=1 Tax=Sphingomonas sp. PP-CE-1A-559 TaxID=2135657 RepID=UPI0010566D45|nr:hypothetical protein [Sphingomonas sp. PP-CE-1A-559]TCP91878.1 hypothetical protein C8J42_103570 [Sphingomonas sp. PP-CE-1A-559]